MVILLHNRNVALLWAGSLVSLMGDFALLVALPLWVYQTTGSAAATGAMVLARRLPELVLGPLAGSPSWSSARSPASSSTGGIARRR